MSPSIEEASVDDRLTLLKRRSQVVGSRLLRVADALDARRRQVTRIKDKAKDLVVPAAIAVLGVAAIVGVGAALLGVALARRRHPSVSKRVGHALQRRLDIAQQPSLGRRMFDKVALTVVTFAASELSRRLGRPGSPSPRRLTTR